MRMRLFTSLIVTAAMIAFVITGCGRTAAPPAAQTATLESAAAGPTPALAVAPTTASAAASTRAPEATPKASFPEKGKVVTMIVPWNAGGSTDVGARALAPALETALGRQIQIVNKPGASWQIGITDMVKSKPDGYTIAWTNIPNSMSPYLDPCRQCAYSRKDLAMVANVVIDSQILAVRPDSKYKTLKDLIEDARANPEQVKVGMGGIGSSNHLLLEMLQDIAQVKLNLVNFAEGGGGVTALLGGHVDATLTPLGNWAAQVKAGGVRFLAIADDQRSEAASPLSRMCRQSKKQATTWLIPQREACAHLPALLKRSITS